MLYNKRVDHFTFYEKLIFKLLNRFMTDKKYAEWSMKRWFNIYDIEKPKTFNEKLQWLKLNDRNPDYINFTDKVLVKEFISKNIGKEFIAKTYATWRSVDDINFDDLPNEFILKTNHGSGGNIIVRNKNEVNLSDIKAKFNKWLKDDYYKKGREWVYKDIDRKILCEELLIDEDGNIPKDFKLFCFNGKPLYIQVDFDRFTNHERVFYDVNWIKQDFNILYPLSDKSMDRPSNLDEMINIASRLSENMKFCRIDLYSIPHIIFGEITFYPGNGAENFSSYDWDLKFGELIKL